MSKVKFPRRWADGSFCIEVILSVATADTNRLLHQVQDWAIKWVKANQVWTRNWSNGKVEELLYQHEFKREPLVIFCNPSQLKIQLEGQPSAKWWKDWVVLRFLKELMASFAEIQDVKSINNCD